MSSFRGSLSVLVPVTVAETLGVVAFRLMPGHVLTAFFYVCAGNATLMVIWNVFIWSFFFDPLRHLPTIWQPLRLIDMLFRHPRGKPCLSWLRTMPHNELIYVRTGLSSGVLLVTGQHALRDVLSTNSYDFVKLAALRDIVSHFIGYALPTSEGVTHKMYQKAMAPAFTIKQIRAWYPIMWRKTQVFLHRVEQDIQAYSVPGRTSGQLVGFVEMRRLVNRLTLDILALVGVSCDFRSLEIENHPVAQTLDTITTPCIEYLLLVAVSMFVPQWLVRMIPCKANIFVLPRARDSRERMLSDVLRKRRAENQCENREGDILDTMIRSGKLSDNELQHQIFALFGAGYETTGGTISWCCYHLSIEPHIQTALRNEIRSWIPSASASVSSKDFESMPYLNGVCEEVLRLYPVTSLLTREALRETTIAGQMIPAGTGILISPYAINRSPEFWGETAEQFYPERWIDKDEKTGRDIPNRHGGARTKYAHLTFLHGPRSCIAKDLARAVLRCAVVGIFGRFKVELKEVGQKVTVGGTLSSQPIEMHLKLSKLPGWD